MRLRLEAKIRAVLADSTIRGTVALAGCTGLGAIFMIAASPVLTRLFTPEVFGVMAVYTSVVSIFTTVGCLRYELAILLPEDDETAANLLLLSLLVLISICSVLAVVVWLWSGQFAAWLNCPALAPYLWTTPLGVLGGGAYQALSCWALRKEAFFKVARTRLSQNAGMVITQIGLGALISGSPAGLLIGDLVSRFGGVGLLLRYAWPSITRKRPTLAIIRSCAKRYAKFPLFSTSAGLLTAISTQIPIIVLSRYFGPSVAGWYALTYRVLRTPTALLGQAASQSLFANAARISRDREQLRVLTERAAIVLVAVGVPIFALVVQEGGDVFTTVFGSGWQRAGLYAQILSPWFFVSFVSNPLSNLLTIREWQGTTLFYSALECATVLGCLLVGVKYHSDLVVLAALGGGACFLSVITSNRFFQAGCASPARVLKQVAPLLLPVFLCLFLAEMRLGGAGIVPILLRVSAFCIVYCLSVWKIGLFAKA